MSSLFSRIPPKAMVVGLYVVILLFALVAVNNPG